MTDARYDAFLCHSSRNKAWVRKLRNHLVAQGLQVFFDERNIEDGAELYRAIDEGLRASRRVVVILTPDWCESEWARQEAADALGESPLNRDRRLIPILLETCTYLPFPFKSLKHCDLRDELEPRCFELVYRSLLSLVHEQGEGARRATYERLLRGMLPRELTAIALEIGVNSRALPPEDMPHEARAEALMGLVTAAGEEVMERLSEALAGPRQSPTRLMLGSAAWRVREAAAREVAKLGPPRRLSMRRGGRAAPGDEGALGFCALALGQVWPSWEDTGQTPPGLTTMLEEVEARLSTDDDFHQQVERFVSAAAARGWAEGDGLIDPVVRVGAGALAFVRWLESLPEAEARAALLWCLKRLVMLDVAQRAVLVRSLLWFPGGMDLLQSWRRSCLAVAPERLSLTARVRQLETLTIADLLDRELGHHSWSEHTPASLVWLRAAGLEARLCTTLTALGENRLDQLVEHLQQARGGDQARVARYLRHRLSETPIKEFPTGEWNLALRGALDPPTAEAVEAIMHDGDALNRWLQLMDYPRCEAHLDLAIYALRSRPGILGEGLRSRAAAICARTLDLDALWQKLGSSRQTFIDALPSAERRGRLSALIENG